MVAIYGASRPTVPNISLRCLTDVLAPSNTSLAVAGPRSQILWRCPCVERSQLARGPFKKLVPSNFRLVTRPLQSENSAGLLRSPTVGGRGRWVRPNGRAAPLHARGTFLRCPGRRRPRLKAGQQDGWVRPSRLVSLLSQRPTPAWIEFSTQVIAFSCQSHFILVRCCSASSHRRVGCHGATDWP